MIVTITPDAGSNGMLEAQRLHDYIRKTLNGSLVFRDTVGVVVVDTVVPAPNDIAARLRALSAERDRLYAENIRLNGEIALNERLRAEQPSPIPYRLHCLELAIEIGANEANAVTLAMQFAAFCEGQTITAELRELGDKIIKAAGAAS